MVDYVEWAVMEIHQKKRGVTAMDMRNCQRVATDSITLHGQPFPVILPNQLHRHLGLRMAMNGNFIAVKEHVRTDMKQRLAALAEDRVLTQEEKERIITTAVWSLFTYIMVSLRCGPGLSNKRGHSLAARIAPLLS